MKYVEGHCMKKHSMSYLWKYCFYFTSLGSSPSKFPSIMVPLRLSARYDRGAALSQWKCCISFVILQQQL